MADPLTSVVLRLAYDGTAFHGFAESEGVRTVCGEVRAAAARVTRSEEISIRGASRTDTGVHALDQCLRLDVASDLGAQELGRALTSLAPDDLEVLSHRPAEPDFDPVRGAIEKLYVYRLWNAPSTPVLARSRLWGYRGPLDLSAMREAAGSLVGTHDFAAFRTRSKGETENTVRTLRALEISSFGPELAFQVIGEGFLYRMVRNIVGTLVEVGRGARPVGSVAETHASGDRRLAGPSAPPQGLHLVRLRYEGEPPCRPLTAPLAF